MKKTHIYLLASVLTFSAVSCEDWMNVDPAGQQNATNYWANAGEVEAVLGTAYRNMRTAVTNRTFINWGEMRGNGLGVLETNAYNIRTGDILPSNSLCKWADLYNVIGMANSVIDYAPTVVEKDASFTEGEMRSIVAEAHFLRALSYLTLVRTFKDVPYVTHSYVTDDADFWIPKTDGDSILRSELALMQPYLENAREFFPDEADNKGRATRWALYTVMADMYLWLSASDYDSGNSATDLQNCIDCCDAVINSGRVGLIDGSLWFTNFFPGNSNESIFELQFSNPLAQTNSFMSWFGGTDAALTASSGQYYYVSTVSLFRFASWLTPGDVRGDGASYASITSTVPQSTVWKYYGSDTQNTARNDTENDQNWIIYRLAEVYLMKAEALAMQGDLDGALAALNEVRERGGSEALERTQYGSKYAVVEAIPNERSIEFLGEAKNWYDLLRTGLRYQDPEFGTLYQQLFFDETVEGLPSVSAALVRSKMRRNIPYSWYLPIHTDELAANTSLVQNPAYANLGE